MLICRYLMNHAPQPSPLSHHLPKPQLPTPEESIGNSSDRKKELNFYLSSPIGLISGPKYHQNSWGYVQLAVLAFSKDT
jgi:hypothetical protein